MNIKGILSKQEEENNKVINLELYLRGLNSSSPNYTKMSVFFAPNLNYIKMLVPLASVFLFWESSVKKDSLTI